MSDNNERVTDERLQWLANSWEFYADAYANMAAFLLGAKYRDTKDALIELQQRRQAQAPLEALVAACRDAIGRIDVVQESLSLSQRVTDRETLEGIAQLRRECYEEGPLAECRIRAILAQLDTAAAAATARKG